ncbi:MAG: serine/threonine-protein kinase [Aureliella sp.]
MIARQPPCDVGQLAEMLEDRLDRSQQALVTHHLDRCTYCQQQLERLTADDTWWVDARQTLLELSTNSSDERSSLGAEITTAHSWQDKQPKLAGRPAAIEQQEHWVLALLQPTDDTSLLGKLDGLDVEAVIGQGGMGVVLRARDTSLQRHLAIKLLSPMLAGTGAARQRFFREARAAAAVVHPNIVPIYAVSTERSLPYLVMPLVAGGNLQHAIDQDGPLPLERSLSIGLQVAEGLAAAHRQGIVHRDIKPANLLLDEGGFRILITDFGLARALDDATLTGSGLLAGTPQYMSPEQARGAELDHRTDIYSLGAVLYAMATGRPPVRGASTLDVLRRIAEEQPRSIVEINPAYPFWYQRLVQLLMAPKAAERIQSAEQVAELVRGALAHARAPTHVALPAALRMPKRLWLKRTAIVALLLLCLPLAIYTSKPWWQVATQAQPIVSNQLEPGDLARTSAVPVTEPEVKSIDSKPNALTEIEPWQSSEFEKLLDSSQQQLQRLQSEVEGPDMHEKRH